MHWMCSVSNAVVVMRSETKWHFPNDYPLDRWMLAEKLPENFQWEASKPAVCDYFTDTALGANNMLACVYGYNDFASNVHVLGTNPIISIHCLTSGSVRNSTKLHWESNTTTTPHREVLHSCRGCGLWWRLTVCKNQLLPLRQCSCRA